MNIDIELLGKLEQLSHLHINDKDKSETISQLSNILEYVENLNDLDTSNIDSHYSTINSATLLREDVSNSNKDIYKRVLSNSPSSENNFFIVPAIID